jgi:hypothetical protein
MPFVISHVRGRKIFASHFAKFALPVIQPDLESFASERLLDDDVDRAVLVHIQGCYCQCGFVRFEGEVGISATREMKLYSPRAVLSPNPAIIDKDSAIGFVVAVEIGSGKRLTKRRPETRWR